MQVLLVEDDLTWAGSVELMLRKSGHDCVVVNMGGPAVELAKTGAFDLIILDVLLPDVDGLEVMHRLRQAGCETPVLVQSGLTDQSDAQAFGAEHVLIKPFGHLELIETMVKILTGPRAKDAKKPKAEATPAESDDVLTLTPIEEEAGKPPVFEPDAEDDIDEEALWDDEEGLAMDLTSPQTKVMMAAEILEGDKPHSCMVLNLTDAGASIRLPRHLSDPPSVFRLRLQSGYTQYCRLCWQAHNKIGVKFVTKEEAAALPPSRKKKSALDSRL